MITQYKPTEMDTAIISNITQEIRESLKKWYGSGSRLEATIPEIRSYRNSFMLRYPITTYSEQKRNILVKIRRNPKMGSLNQAVSADIHQNVPAEYASMQYVFERTDPVNPDFAAIRPLSYIDPYFAIVMEEFPSRTLRQLLDGQRISGSVASLSDLKDAARKTGKWLNFFHHYVHTSAGISYTTDDILQEVRSYADLIDSCSLGRVRAGQILEAFSRKLARIQIDRLELSQSHADMSCDNVLYSADRRVCVIDIKTRLAPIYADLGALLVHPDTAKLQIFSGGRYYSEHLLSCYRSEIAAGYLEQRPGSVILVRIYSAVKILEKWLMYEELMSRYKGIKHVLAIPAGPFVSAYFHRLLKKYLDLIGDDEFHQEINMENAQINSTF